MARSTVRLDFSELFQNGLSGTVDRSHYFERSSRWGDRESLGLVRPSSTWTYVRESERPSLF